MLTQVRFGRCGRTRSRRSIITMQFVAAGMLIAGLCVILVLLGGSTASKTMAAGNGDVAATTAPTGSALVMFESPRLRASAYLNTADRCLSDHPRDLPGAVDALEKAVAIDPEDSVAYRELSMVQLLLGHGGSAQRALDEYQRLVAGR